jgi:T-complex protein 1 subunit gamma
MVIPFDVHSLQSAVVLCNCPNSLPNSLKGKFTLKIRQGRKTSWGEIEKSCVLNGVMLNKDITHPNMRRRIVKPRIILLDCPLEYKKGESQTNMEFSKESDWERAQSIEEEQVKLLANKILEFKPDLVITEKGVSGQISAPLSFCLY